MFSAHHFDRVSIKEASVGKLGSICRRIYRIFSHAYFHHRNIYDEFENETYLCHRFTQFVTKYTLMSKENLIVPIDDETVTAATVTTTPITTTTTTSTINLTTNQTSTADPTGELTSSDVGTVAGESEA